MARRAGRRSERRVAHRLVPRRRGRAGVGGQAQAPPLPELVRIDEARAAADVAAEVERGERRPIRAVAQEIVRDAPERVARPHRVGRGRTGQSPGTSAASRPGALPAASDGGRSAADRRAGPGAGGQREGRADAREGEHAERDACGHPVEDRRAPAHADLTVADVATTARSSCAQQAAQATQAARTRTHSASRGSGRQACPSPPASGLPTTTTSTAGTAVNASRAATTAPTTSRIRSGRPRRGGVYPPAGPMEMV